MSDFLKQFEKEQYQDSEGLSHDKDLNQACDKSDKKAAHAHRDGDTPRSKKKRQKIQSAEHEIRKDTNYDRRALIKYLSIASSVLAICMVAFAIFYFSNQVTVRDFVGVNITEARTWGLSHRITLDAREEYSLEYDEGIVITQSRRPDSKMQRGQVLSLAVSKGADQSEHIELPDFASMTTLEVRQWRQDFRALNVNVNEEYRTDIEAGHFIRLEFPNASVNATNYTRGDGLLVFMSKGKEVFAQNILVPDFLDRAKSEAEEWARQEGIEVDFVEEAHPDIAQGMIAGQSVKAGTLIAKDSEFEVIVSLGASVTIPNFANMSAEDAQGYSGLEVRIQRRFHSSIAFGRLISQSERPGTEFIGESIPVTVIYSLGRPYIEDLRGQGENILAEYFYNFSSQGANINYRVRHVNSHEPKGSIVKMSKYATFLSMSETIGIDVSRGNRQAPAPPADADGE